MSTTLLSKQVEGPGQLQEVQNELFAEFKFAGKLEEERPFLGTMTHG